MKGVIMAGGMGTRLRPLTCNIPKPMVPLVHRPVMEYCIELLKKHGITEIAVTLQYLPGVIKDYFGDGRNYGVKLFYFEETNPLGTAGSIKNAEPFLDERFIVLSGDGLTDFDLSKGIEFHQQKGALATIFMKQVETPHEFGVVKTNDKDEVVRFQEKPSWDQIFSDTINTGIYVFEPDVFEYLEKDVPTDFSNDLIPRLIREKTKVYGYKAKGYWGDIGTLSTYRQTQFDMLNKKVNVHLSGKEIMDGIWIGDNVIVEEGVTLHGPLSIGDGAVVQQGSFVDSHSIIGNYSTIEPDCSLGQSILWNEIYVGSKSELKGTTICKGTRLDQSVSLFEDSVVGAHCKIASNVLVQPEVKVWPNKAIAEAAIVHTSLVIGMNKTKQQPTTDANKIRNFQ